MGSEHFSDVTVVLFHFGLLAAIWLWIDIDMRNRGEK